MEPYAKGPQIVGRDPNLCHETFHSGSWKNLILHFKFTILITQNKYNHLLFYVLSFTQFRAKNCYCQYCSWNWYLSVKYFPQNYMLTKCLCRENLELFFRFATKSICRPLPYAMIQVSVRLSAVNEFRPRQFRSVSAEPLAAIRGTPVEKHCIKPSTYMA